MGYIEPPRAVSSTNITVTVNMLDVVSFSDEEWFQSDGYLNNQRHRLWSNYMKNSYIHKKLVYGTHCPISYKTTVDCVAQTNIAPRYLLHSPNHSIKNIPLTQSFIA
jgi:hypothetical protein